MRLPPQFIDSYIIVQNDANMFTLSKLKFMSRRPFNSLVKICIFGLVSLFILRWTMTKKQPPASCFTGDISVQQHIKRNFIATLKMKKNNTWINDFQPVTKEDSVLVYSAFADRKDKVRVIGITNDTKADVFCVLWNNSTDILTRLVKAYVIQLYEHHNRRHSAVYFICYLCGLQLPDAVSIVHTSDIQNPRNILPLQVKPQLPTKTEFTMCLSPLHTSFNESSQLLEWIELHKILGVKRFLIYEQGVTDDVKLVLKFYNKYDDSLQVLPWSIPDSFCNQSMRQLHSCGQIAALNDCLYRSKGYTHYIAATDVDEVIIPQHKDDTTWNDMFKRLPGYSAYIFRNVYIRKNQTNDDSLDRNRLSFIDNLLKGRLVLQPHFRSKVIAVTDDIVTLGIHFIFAMRKGHELGVDPSDGLMYHYRKIPEINPLGVYESWTRTSLSEKYSQNLKERVSIVRNKMIGDMRKRDTRIL